MGGGIRKGSVVFLSGNPGSGRSTLASHFLLSGEGEPGGKGLWIGIHSSPPILSETLEDRWRDRNESQGLETRDLDLTRESLETCMAAIGAAIEQTSCDRVVIHNVDLLEVFDDRRIFLLLMAALRRHRATAILIGTLPHLGMEISLSPPILASLADAILLTRLAIDNGENHCTLGIVKSDDPGNHRKWLPYRIGRNGITPCAPGFESVSPRSPASAHKPTRGYEIVLEIVYPNPDVKRTIEHRTAELNQQIPDTAFQLKEQKYEDYTQFENRFRDFQDGQKKEDLFPIDICWLQDCVRSGLIHPLTDFLSEEWRDRYLPIALQQCIVDGQIWGIPHSINAGVLAYRRDILEKYQFEPPQTWQELREFADYMLKRENNPALMGFGFQGAPVEALTCNFLEFLWSHGGDIYDGSHHVAINSDRAVEALQCMLNLIHEWKIAPPLAPDMNEDKVSRSFFNEKLLFMRHWTSVSGAAYTDYLSMKDKIKIAPLPSLDRSIPSRGIVGGSCYVIPRYVKDPERLIDFYRRFFSPDAIVELAIKSEGCPVFKSVYTNPDVLRYRPYYEEIPALLARGRSRKDILYYDQLSQLLRTEVHLALRKVKTPREALDRVADELNKSIYQRIHTRRIHTALEYIDLHLSEELSRTTVASQCRLSPSYFGSLFKEATGVSFSDYVNLKRVERAKLLLENSELNIAEISEQVGFSDQSYFCQVFRKLALMTPTQYRIQAFAKRGG